MANNIVLKTYKGGNVTPQDDAIIHDVAIATNGIFKGCEVSHARGNILRVSQGFGMIKGRFFEVYESEVSVQLASAGQTLDGRVYIHMDLSNADEPIMLLAQSATELPALDMDADVNYNNSSFDIQLAAFTVSSSGINNLTQTFTKITPGSGGGGGGGGNSLMRDTQYALGDTATVASAPGWVTLVCTQAGTTALAEPTTYATITSVGDSILDGSCVFTARNIIGELDDALAALTDMDSTVNELSERVEEAMNSSGNLVTKIISLSDYKALESYDENCIYFCYENGNTQQITRIYMGENKVYSTGVTVTYQIDTDYVLKQVVQDGADAVLEAPTAVKSGYEFVGWRQDSSADSKILDNMVIACEEGFSLYAVFKKSVEVSFFASGGTGEMEGVEAVSLYNNGVESGEATDIPWCVYEKEGFAFIGWTLEGSTELILPETKMNFAEDSVLYANWIQEEYEFIYTGSYVQFIIPASGIYKLDVYGGQGGDATYNEVTANGGHGGHSSGYAYLEKGAIIYVAVGGAGEDITSTTYSDYGYNGGSGGSSLTSTSSSYPQSMGTGGGGCTHIASKSGDLKSIAYANLSTVYIVAGGGGGACLRYKDGIPHDGGHGGGEIGGNGSGGALGGRQTSNSSSTTTQFGYAATCSSSSSGYAGGGGGLYGGYYGFGGYSGAGGSGYIGGVPSFSKNKKYYPAEMETGVNEGNGKALITFISCV